MPFKYSAHIGYLFSQRPFGERIVAAAEYGFEAVEHPSPYSVPACDMADWLKRSGMCYTQFGLQAGDASKGEKGIGIFPDRRAEFRQSVAEALDYAEAIGVTMVHAMSGILPFTKRSQHHRDCYIENLDFAARAARSRGIRVLVEPMSHGAVPDYFISTPDQATEIIDETGSDNIGLLFDLYHAANASLDIAQQLRKHAMYISHVHIADFPGRHEPGSGALDFYRIRSVLGEIGYKGWLGCEYVPARTTENGLVWLNEARSRKSVITASRQVFSATP